MVVEHRTIAIGGSTGAVKDLKRILAALPADLSAPVFVVVHVGAQGRNLLAKAFEECGPLPVTTAEDGETIESGHVYIAPSDRHLLVVDGAIRLGRGPRENMARPAVDALFRSVAPSYGSRAIGLVITGHLNDGASGLAAIGQRGGITVVQNPSDAEAPDMPFGALEASDIDYRAPTDELAPLLSMLAQQPSGPEVQASRALELEVDIALGRPCRSPTIAEIATPCADHLPILCWSAFGDQGTAIAVSLSGGARLHGRGAGQGARRISRRGGPRGTAYCGRAGHAHRTHGPRRASRRPDACAPGPA